MQLILKLLSSFSILVATAFLILTLMVTVGISEFIAILGMFLAFYLAYLCWSRPRARTLTTVVSLVAIAILGSFLYSIIPSETVDSNPANYLTADDDFTAHARELMPHTLEYTQATKVEYRHMRYGSSVQYIRLDYSFTEEDFEAQIEAFAQRYPTAKEPFAVSDDGYERSVYPIETKQDAAYCFAYSPDRENHRISLLYVFDPLLTELSASEVLTEWHFATNSTD